jgi:Glycosyl transferases group 1
VSPNYTPTTRWSLGHHLISNVVTTAFRTTIFKSAGTPIDFYGGFTDPDFVADCSRSGLFNAMGCVPFKNLGDIYARYQFSIDVTNSPFIHGSNAKVLNCFAAGGFMFVDRKEDLLHELGDIAEEFMYSNAEELRSKLEDLRQRPARRREIIKIVRDRISADLNFDALLSRTIGQAAARLS